MKNKILIIILFVFGFLSSCTSKFEEYNKDTKNPIEVPGTYVFTHAQYLMNYHLTISNVNVGIFNLMAQYITETTYIDEANWDLANRRIPDNFSRRIYYDLNELKIAKELIEKEVVAGEGPIAEKNNKMFIIDILQAYLWQVLVDIFGDVPYTEALNPINTLPKYDNDETIYADLISKVQAAYNGFNDTYGSFGDADLIYGGDVASWKKFAAGLLIKLAITSWDANPNDSKTIIETYYNKTFASLSEGTYFPFQATSPYQNPLYEDFVASGRKDFVVCQTLLSQMEDYDPRLYKYGQDYERDTNNKIINGGIYGKSNNYPTGAHISDKILAPDFNGFLLTYDEILFYLAEAASRGANVGKTASELYADAIAASFEYWTGSTDSLSDYLTKRPYVDIKSIAKESWIAMYMRGLIGWTTYRRVDGAFNLVVPDDNTPGLSVVPTRFFYPINEQTLNNSNWAAAANEMGGDLLTSKIFWDKY